MNSPGYQRIFTFIDNNGDNRYATAGDSGPTGPFGQTGTIDPQWYVSSDGVNWAGPFNWLRYRGTGDHSKNWKTTLHASTTGGTIYIEFQSTRTYTQTDDTSCMDDENKTMGIVDWDSTDWKVVGVGANSASSYKVGFNLQR